MPSTKNPNPTVDPGPGHLPADTVSVDALTFDIGSSTSLDVHVVDPTGAHAATAISTLALSGETWSFPAGDTQGALARAYQGLNARAFWVLDAAGNADADFKGAGALNQAVTAFIASTRKPALYLRAGTYTWTHPGNNTALNNVRIVGASGLAIVNATTFAVGASTVLESVSLNATTTVTLSGGSATLRRVVINTVTLSNSSAKNVLEDVTVSATGAITLSGLSLSCSGTALTSTSTITQSGNSASIKGGPWAGTTITVSGNDNVFLGVPFTGTTALGGTNNTYLTFGASVGLTVGGASGTGVAPNFARSDHTHALPAGTPVGLTVGGVNAPGSAGTFTHSDHTHALPAGTPVGLTVGGVNAPGSAGTFTHSDHTHALPAYGSTANTFCQGNDPRLQDTRAPSGPAGGGLAGIYPNPTVAAVPESVVRTSLDAVTADVSFNNKKLVKLANPGGGQDAATKNYVDTGLSNVAYRNQSNTFTQTQTMSAGGYSLVLSDELKADGHINGGKSVYAGVRGIDDGDPNHSWEFLYGQVRQRLVTINLASGAGMNVFLASEGQFLALDPAQSVIYPIVVPHGATLGGVLVKLYGISSSEVHYTFKLMRRSAINFLGGYPTYARVGPLVTGDCTGAILNEGRLTFGNLTADSTEDYSLYLLNNNNSTQGLSIFAIQFFYNEQFVRTYGSR